MCTKGHQIPEFVNLFIELLVVAGKVNVHLTGTTGSQNSSRDNPTQWGSHPFQLTSTQTRLTFLQYIMSMVYIFPYEHQNLFDIYFWNLYVP